MSMIVSGYNTQSLNVYHLSSTDKAVDKKYEELKTKFQGLMAIKNPNSTLSFATGVKKLLQDEWIPGAQLLNNEESKSIDSQITCFPQLDAFPDIRERIRVAKFCDIKAKGAINKGDNVRSLLDYLWSKKDPQFVKVVHAFLGEVTSPVDLAVSSILLRLFSVIPKIPTVVAQKALTLIKNANSEDEREEILRTLSAEVRENFTSRDVERGMLVKNSQYHLKIYR
jgi:hypothetical protein